MVEIVGIEVGCYLCAKGKEGNKYPVESASVSDQVTLGHRAQTVPKTLCTLPNSIKPRVPIYLSTVGKPSAIHTSRAP